MENLIIKNNSGSENIGSDVLLKIYDLALQINGTIQLKGNVIVPHAKLSVLTYFENNFPDLHIMLTGLKYIDFADPVVAWHVAKSYDPDGIGITLSDLNSINWLTTSMLHNTLLTTFNELSLFTNITTIKLETFKDCTSLTSIGLDNITTINVSAFENCTSLNSNNIDLSNVTTIRSSAFKGCTGLTSIDLSSLLTLEGSVNTGAFLNCTNLTTVTLNPNLKKIARGTFRGCTKLTNIDLSNVTQIHNAAFQDCTSLTSINIPHEIEFEDSVFYGCTNLGVNLEIDIMLTGDNYPSNLFYGTKYKRIIIGSINTLDYDCRYPIYNNIPSTEYLDLSGLKLYPFSSGSKRLWGSTYTQPNNLTTIILSPDYTRFEWRASDYLSKLLYFIMLSDAPPSLESTNIFNKGNLTLYVKDAATKALFEADSLWSEMLNRESNPIQLDILANLPVGVWKTGLYQLYEPYLSNSSDPAYATT